MTPRARKNTSKSSDESSTTSMLSFLADEVIANRWGTGNERMKRLAAAGYDATAVMAEVDRKSK